MRLKKSSSGMVGPRGSTSGGGQRWSSILEDWADTDTRVGSLGLPRLRGPGLARGPSGLWSQGQRPGRGCWPVALPASTSKISSAGNAGSPGPKNKEPLPRPPRKGGPSNLRAWRGQAGAWGCWTGLPMLRPRPPARDGLRSLGGRNWGPQLPKPEVRNSPGPPIRPGGWGRGAEEAFGLLGRVWSRGAGSGPSGHMGQGLGGSLQGLLLRIFGLARGGALLCSVGMNVTSGSGTIP